MRGSHFLDNTPRCSHVGTVDKAFCMYKFSLASTESAGFLDDPLQLFGTSTFGGCIKMPIKKTRRGRSGFLMVQDLLFRLNVLLFCWGFGPKF